MGPRVLLVDDHQILREGLAAMLSVNWGYDICGQAGNGREAIQKAIQLQPDVVVLDLRMPVMGGSEAAREIRRISPRTKIVFLSMHDAQTAPGLARSVRADAWISKRCPTEELHRVITDVLEAPSMPARAKSVIKFGLFDPT